jgi:hypothetical protein
MQIRDSRKIRAPPEACSLSFLYNSGGLLHTASKIAFQSNSSRAVFNEMDWYSAPQAPAGQDWTKQSIVEVGVPLLNGLAFR